MSEPMRTILESEYLGLHSVLHARLKRIDELEAALRGLYEDNVDYLTLNHLGGMNNHWMIRAREALGITLETKDDQ